MWCSVSRSEDCSSAYFLEQTRMLRRVLIHLFYGWPFTTTMFIVRNWDIIKHIPNEVSEGQQLLLIVWVKPERRCGINKYADVETSTTEDERMSDMLISVQDSFCDEV